ncbi:MAG TPA: cysteine desulfurase [Stellaceae bacterium]|nr:cysteine desulfurase [Stellaceae bacterium]
MSANAKSERLSDPAAIRAQFPVLRREGFHYLDSAATAQMPQAVIDAIYHFGTSLRANVYGGVYSLAREALAAYEGARGDVARFIGAASPSEIVFTYGTTSALNLLARSFGERLGPGDEIVLSLLEHHSNTLPWRALARRRGLVFRVLPVTPDGRIDLEKLSELVTSRCRLIALTHCSNVTGAITDVPSVVAAARAVGAVVALDGAQQAPHGPVDVQGLGIDFYAFSGHKTYGPTGIGVLWGRADLLADMPPFMLGGQMIRRVSPYEESFADPPRRFEAGTPPIGAAIGLGAAMRWTETLDWPVLAARERELTARLITGIAGCPAVRIVGPRTTERRRGVVSFTVAGLGSEDVCRRLDAHGLALRHGHHCAQPFMMTLGIEGTARASIAPYTSEGDIDALIAAVAELAPPRRPSEGA